MFDVDINITGGGGGGVVEQGITTKESEFISFVKTKTDNIISDIIGTSEKDSYLYV